MKKIFLMALAVAWAAGCAACDVCGCSLLNGNSMGIMPNFTRHFIGLKYNFATYHSQHLTFFEGQAPEFSDENFHSLTLWGRFVPHKRVQLFGFIPFNNFIQKTESAIRVMRGLGDPSVLATYVLFNNIDSVRRGFKHSLQVGGGLKLPLGKYEDGLYDEKGEEISPNMQPGSGAFGFPIKLIYTARTGSFGLNAEAGYTYTTTNPDHYRFGNSAQGALRFFYWRNFRKFTLLPHAGISYEHMGRDYDVKEYLDYTGGHMLSLTASADVYVAGLMLGAGIQAPLKSNMGSGYVTPGPRFSFNISYMLRNRSQ